MSTSTSDTVSPGGWWSKTVSIALSPGHAEAEHGEAGGEGKGQ